MSGRYGERKRPLKSSPNAAGALNVAVGFWQRPKQMGTSGIQNFSIFKKKREKKAKMKNIKMYFAFGFFKREQLHLLTKNRQLDWQC